MDAVRPGLLAVRGLVEPLAEGGLLGGGLGLDGAIVSNSATPHGLSSSPSVPASMRSHCTPATERA